MKETMHQNITERALGIEISSDRPVASIHRGSPFHWVGDGFKVSTYFPNHQLPPQATSPFILLDYGPPVTFPPSDEVRGVGAHPHRGFETVTIAFEGSVEHNDSFGNSGIIGPGDVQWMTAGSGLLHKEYQEKNFAFAGGRMHMAQIWVNLPKAHKMSKPGYQAITAAEIPIVDLGNNSGTIRVIAGEFEGTRGAAHTFTQLNLFDIKLNASGSVSLSVPALHNATLLIMKGEVKLNGTSRATELDLVSFEHSGDHIRVEATTESQLLLMSGEPIDEPVVQYGPFVMNTREEISEAIQDFNSGKFGSFE